jgi:hypothetical protein
VKKDDDSITKKYNEEKIFDDDFSDFDFALENKK